jgi:uncharacterized phage-like protein YoqJ
MTMIICGTGHRPDKLGGYSGRVRDRLVDLAIKALERYKPEHVITGMALGWDTALADAADVCGIPYTAAVPFRGQESRWPAEARTHYQTILADADDVVYVCDPGYAAWKMQRRNEWMVNESNSVLALWNGTSGGTANCVHYAESKGKQVINLWPSWAKFSGIPVVVK